MVGHDNVCVQLIIIECGGGIVDCISHNLSDIVAFHPGGPGPCFVQKTIHPDKSFACCQACRWRKTVVRQTAVKMPGEEQRFPGRLPMRQPATIERHERQWHKSMKIL